MVGLIGGIAPFFGGLHANLWAADLAGMLHGGRGLR
jgi:hypothetical protein